MAVSRLSNLASLMNVKSRTSVAPSLATVASVNEEEKEIAGNESMQEEKKLELVQNTDDKVDMTLEENNEKISIRKC